MNNDQRIYSDKKKITSDGKAQLKWYARTNIYKKKKIVSAEGLLFQ